MSFYLFAFRYIIAIMSAMIITPRIKNGLFSKGSSKAESANTVGIARKKIRIEEKISFFIVFH